MHAFVAAPPLTSQSQNINKVFIKHKHLACLDAPLEEVVLPGKPGQKRRIKNFSGIEKITPGRQSNLPKGAAMMAAQKKEKNEIGSALRVVLRIDIIINCRNGAGNKFIAFPFRPLFQSFLENAAKGVEVKYHAKVYRFWAYESKYQSSDGLQKQDCNIIIKNKGVLPMIKEEQMQAQSLESNPSVEFQYLTTKTYEELINSHQLAKTFIAQLGPLRDTPVSEALLAYSRQMDFDFKSAELVMDLMESRLNKMIKNNKLKKNWSEEDLHILVWLLSKYMQKNEIESHEFMTKQDWARLSSMIPGSTPRGCLFKFVSLKKFKLAQHKWQKEQQALLYKIIGEIGTKSWKAISQRLYEESPKRRIFRTAKQCRQHWSCYLDPKIKKGPWDREEDKKLLKIVLDSNCQKKWSQIKLQFQGRTENALKNRYNLLLDKQKKCTPLEKEQDLILQNLKEQKQDTSDLVRKSDKASPKQRQQTKPQIAIPEPVYPVVPEQQRSANMHFNPGYIILFNNLSPDGSVASSLPLNWFYQL